MAVVTWDGSSSTDFATAANWDTGSVPTSSDDVIIPDTSSINNCVLGAHVTINSLAIAANGTLVGGGYRITVDGENGSGYAVDNDGIISGNLDLYLETQATTALDLNGSSGNFRDVRVNHVSCDAQLAENATIGRDLVVAAGEFDTASNRDLTVTGDVSVTGILTGNASAISFGSLTINSGGTYSATSGTTTITSETSGGVAVSNSGTFTHNSGTVSIQTPAATFTSPVNYNNLIINHASAAVKFTGSSGSTMTIAGDLTITQGSFENNISDANLTVTGDVSVTGTLTGNSGAMTFGSLTINSGGTYSATSGTTTITSMTSTGSGDRSLNNKSGGTFTDNNGTVLFNAAGDQRMEMAGTGNVHNLTLNKSDNDFVTFGNLTVEGDLSITLATVHTMRPNNASETLTVTGDVTIVEGKVGDVTNYTGAMSFGSLTIESGGTYIATSGTTTIKGNASSSTNLALNIDSNATFTHNSGTILFDGTNTFGGSSYGHFYFGDKTFNDITINASGKFIQPRKSNDSTLDINGDLTITAGQLSNYNNGISWDIAGDVDVSGTLGITDSTGAYSFGGIRINSGGTYNATSGTTTVTNRFTGTSNLWKNDGGTFNHNNGTVKFTDNDHSLVKELTFYNLEQASSLGDYALSWETQSGTACTILGNLTITRGDFEIHAAGNTLDIHGQTILNGSSDTGARFNNDKNQTGTITHHGIVTINGGTYHVEDGATVNMAGIRNLGGVVD